MAFLIFFTWHITLIYCILCMYASLITVRRRNADRDLYLLTSGIASNKTFAIIAISHSLVGLLFLDIW